MRMIGALLMAIFLCVAVPVFAGTPGKACATKVAACGKCGDGYCAKQCGETAQSCPKDCGTVERVQGERLACGKCGDGRCTPQCGETSQSCPKDCGVESDRLVVSLGR